MIDRFDHAYDDPERSPAPWDIGRAQPAIVELAEAGLIRGRVIDVGCGSGENALELARRGHEVLGVDPVAPAVALAAAKARAAGLPVRFRVLDAMRLGASGERANTLIDSGVFHVFEDQERAEYLANLHAALKPGGAYHMLVFSDREPGTYGPRRVTRAEIEGALGDGWALTEVRPRRFLHRWDPAGAHAWLATAIRM